ncbi:NUDIX hydrolase [Segniliparus rotundus DSM 44985]|uniref:NUDIX hydrolase n=1 Tax=Segniliparus rotundus (strain ATCC BAA-972 / CDC 1076 / CIP 108378 / DSM 44985 / JCM 13578) TaxID=640132 RepID=D6ZDC6_SEGRD|nr:NUDIX hydrolase [Segniliparus rotundus DSM 44985]
MQSYYHSTRHEVLVTVLQHRYQQMHVLLWERGLAPEAGKWSLPGGTLGCQEDVETSARRQLAEKVDVQEIAHLEQLSVFSDPARMPTERVVATTFLGLVPTTADPALPPDTAWFPAAALPELSFDHKHIVAAALSRLAAKLSYTNIAFALAPTEFALSTLRDIYSAALERPVDATNLARVLGRRGVLVPTGRCVKSGGRPATVYRFAERELRVTDEFAVLRPPALKPRAGAERRRGGSGEEEHDSGAEEARGDRDMDLGPGEADRRLSD